MNLLTSLRTLLLALVLSLGISYVYAAWAPPGTTPPGGNIDAPVNVGGASQTKTGPLTVGGSFWSNTFVGSTGSGYFGGNLQVVGNIQVPTLCLSGDCKSAWPVGGSGTITGVTAGTGLTGGGTSGNVTLNVKNSPAVYQCPSYQESGVNPGTNGYISCGTGCISQLATAGASCSYQQYSPGNGCMTWASLNCSTLLGYLVQP